MSDFSLFIKLIRKEYCVRNGRRKIAAHALYY